MSKRIIIIILYITTNTIAVAQSWHELKLDVPGLILTSQAYTLGYEYQMNKHWGANLEVMFENCCKEYLQTIPSVTRYRQEVINLSMRKHFMSGNKAHSFFTGLGVMYISSPRHPEVDPNFKDPPDPFSSLGYTRTVFYYQHGFAFSGVLGYKATIKKQLILEPSLWVNRNFIAYSVDPVYHHERRFGLVALFFKLGYRFSHS